MCASAGKGEASGRRVGRGSGSGVAAIRIICVCDGDDAVAALTRVLRVLTRGAAARHAHDRPEAAHEQRALVRQCIEQYLCE